MRKILFIVIFISMIIMNLNAQATGGKGKMHGTVLDASTAQPISGVKVKMYSVKAASYHPSVPKTDENGKWKVLYLRSGLWHLDFEKVGYETKKISFMIKTTPGEKRPAIEVSMKKIEGPALETTILDEIEKGNILVMEKKYDQAIKIFEALKVKYQESTGITIINLYIGNCYSALESYEKAIEYFKLAHTNFPKNKEIIVSVANAYNNLGDNKNAMIWYKKIPFDEIDNSDALYNMGVIFFNGGNYEEAAKYFKKATEVNPAFADAYYQLGITCTSINRVAEAIDALKKFMELDPESPNYETAKAVVEAFSK